MAYILSVKKSDTGSRLVTYKGGTAEIKDNHTSTRVDFKYLVIVNPEHSIPERPVVAKYLSDAYGVIRSI